MRYVLMAICFAILVGCSVGPSNNNVLKQTVDNVSKADVSVPSEKVRIIITRSSGLLYFALSARLEINGQRVASLKTGETYSGLFDAGKISIATDHWSSPGKFMIDLNGEPGAEYCFELSPRGDSFLPGALFGVVGLAVDASVNSNAGLFKIVIIDVKKS